MVQHLTLAQVYPRVGLGSCHQQPRPYPLRGIGLKSPTSPGILSLGPGVRVVHLEHSHVSVIMFIFITSNSHNEPMNWELPFHFTDEDAEDQRGSELPIDTQFISDLGNDLSRYLSDSQPSFPLNNWPQCCAVLFLFHRSGALAPSLIRAHSSSSFLSLEPTQALEYMHRGRDKPPRTRLLTP